MGSPATLPRMSHRAMSTAEVARTATDEPPKPMNWLCAAFQARAMSRGSEPIRSGADVSCRYASTAATPTQVSPSPVIPASVCTWTNSMLG